MAEERSNPQLDITLRIIREDDLPLFFDFQRDPEANYMAAFTAKDPADWEAFRAHWKKILDDKTIVLRTILYQGDVAGHVSSHSWFGDLEISFWLGREFWGNGIATEAVRQFLELQTSRPIHARAVKDNMASIRVLEKCGFKPVGEDRGFSNARQMEVEEVIMVLDK